METQKVLGDTKSLMEEIDEYINQVDNEEQKLVLQRRKSEKRPHCHADKGYCS